MPQATVDFTIGASLQRVWDFVSDMQAVGSCVPGVEEVRVIDKDTSEWTLKIKLGFFSRTITLGTRALRQEPPRHAEFEGEGGELRIEGRIDLTPISEAETQIHYEMKANAKGPLAAVIDNIIRESLGNQTQEFAENVKRKLQ